jgi:hypothetical protein
MERISEVGTTLVVTSNRLTLRRNIVTANVVPSSLTLVTMMMEALRSSETSVLTRAARVRFPALPYFLIVRGLERAAQSRVGLIE